MEAINYLSLGLKDNKQLGTKTEDSIYGNELNYTDGLSLKELKKIDKNGDGAITESEFKKAFGSKNKNYKEYWDAYKKFYAASTKTNKDNTSTSTATVNGKTVKSSYDKSGKLTGYTVTSKDSNGKTTTVTYTVVNGVASKKSTKVTNLNGTSQTTNASTKAVTKISVNKTSVTKNKDGKLTTITTKDKADKITFGYDKSGKLKNASVTIGNKTIKGDIVTTTKDKSGNTTKTIKKGNIIVAKIHTKTDGSQYVTEYKNGVKYKEINIKKSGEATEIKTYATSGKQKGKKISQENCTTGLLRKYSYDNKGNLSYSIDYDINGKKTSKQTYIKVSASNFYKNRTGQFWATRTFYDENGKENKYEEYSHKANNKDKTSVTKIDKIYSDSSKKDLLKTVIYTKDGYCNDLKAVVKEKNQDTKYITYEYTTKTSNIKSRLTYKDLAKKITEQGTTTTTDTYKNGQLSHREVQTVTDGISKTTKYDYTYYDDGSKKTQKVTDNSKEVTTYKYKTDGSYTKEYIKDNKTVIEYYDKDKKLLRTETKDNTKSSVDTGVSNDTNVSDGTSKSSGTSDFGSDNASDIATSSMDANSDTSKKGAASEALSNPLQQLGTVDFNEIDAALSKIEGIKSKYKLTKDEIKSINQVIIERLEIARINQRIRYIEQYQGRSYNDDGKTIQAEAESVDQQFEEKIDVLKHSFGL